MSKSKSISWDGFSLKKKREMPEGLWQKCVGCGDMIFSRSIKENMGICPQCEHHYRLSAAQRVQMMCDEGSFEEMFADYNPVDPLEFNDQKKYSDRLTAMQKKTGLKDAILTGKGFIKGRPIILAALDPGFMMGSMGSVVGEKIAKSAEAALETGYPLIVVSCSGGARMQEGVLSLAQMAKTSAAIGKLHDNGGMFISVLTDPTSGGVTASFAMLGDFIIAEPRALICFAGPRTIWHTIKVELPEGFQRAEFLLEHGFVDRIVHRKELRSEIARMIDYCGK